VYESETAVAVELQDVLAPGERLLWHGRPKQGFALRGLDALLLPLTFVIVVAMLFLVPQEFMKTGDRDLLLFALVLAPIALYSLVGRFFVDARMRRGRHYYLTDRRAVIIDTWPSHSIREVDLQTPQRLTYTKRSDGTSTIEFGQGSDWRWLLGYRFWHRGAFFPLITAELLPPAFEMIEDGSHVRALITQAQMAQPPVDRPRA
jgi:hypothetical protein